MWNLRNIYFYLVSLISIVLIIVGLISFLHSLADVFMPTDYQPPMPKYNEQMDMTKEEFEARVEKQREIQKQNERNRDIRDCVRAFSMFIVALPFYLYHWRKIQQEHAK